MEETQKKKCTWQKKVAIAITAIAVLMGLISFMTPPPWTIDSSVIAFNGEVFAFDMLFMAWDAIERGIDAKIVHKGTELDLKNPDNPEG